MAEILAANQITIAKVLDGEKGYSPTVTTGTSSDGSTTVTVTNKDGSTTTTLVDGKARADIDNLEIGGRNLAISSLNFDRREIIYNVSKGIEIIEYDDRTAIKFTGENTATIIGCYLITPYTVTVEDGVITGSNFNDDTFIISFDYKCESSLQTTTFQLRLFSYNDSTDTYTNTGRLISTNRPKAQLTATSNWKRAKTGVLSINNPIALTNTGTLTGTFAIGIGYINNPGVAFEMSKIKFEIGNRATDWTPAPEDVDAGIDNASKVATNFIGYDSTNGLIIGNKTSGTWSGYRSQILPGSFNVLDPSSTVLASFGTTTVIGEEAKANMHLTFNNFSMVDKDGTTLFEVGDTRNADGMATVKHTTTVSVDSAGSVTIIVKSKISSIVSVYADSVELSSSKYSFSGFVVTINGLTSNSRKNIEITYTTTESTTYLSFGKRDSSGNIGNYSVAEGYNVIASGYCSHAENSFTTASGGDSHAEGNSTTASGYCSHAGGGSTVADGDYMTAIGEYNTRHSGKAFVIGNGTGDTARSDAFTVDWNGNATMKGGLTLGTALSIANGGTGAETAAEARKNLGLTDKGWVDLTTEKGTWDYCQYRYKNGIVYIRGYATAYAWSGSTGDVIVAAGTIPSQYRPPANLDLIVRCGGTRWGQAMVTPAGGIIVDRILNGTTSYTSSGLFRFNGSYPI